MDIASISAVVAAGGVIVGVAFAYFEVRNISKARQTDLVLRLFSMWDSEHRKAWYEVMNTEFDSYDDFVEKYGGFLPPKAVQMAFLTVGSYFESLGILLHRRLIDIDLPGEMLPIKETWEKMKPIVEGGRKQYNTPELYEWFEYLHNKTQKRLPTLPTQQ